MSARETYPKAKILLAGCLLLTGYTIVRELTGVPGAISDDGQLIASGSGKLFGTGW